MSADILTFSCKRFCSLFVRLNVQTEILCPFENFRNISQFYRLGVKQHIQVKNYLKVVAITYAAHVPAEHGTQF